VGAVDFVVAVASVQLSSRSAARDLLPTHSTVLPSPGFTLSSRLPWRRKLQRSG